MERKIGLFSARGSGTGKTRGHWPGQVHSRPQLRSLPAKFTDCAHRGLILRAPSAKYDHKVKSQRPAWLIAKLEEDLNWWVAETSDERSGESAPRGLLDPRQVAHLVGVLEDYQEHGLPDSLLTGAFHVYSAETELSDGRLRLTASDDNILNTGSELFALPAPGYEEFLDALSAAHIRRLNATHHFAHRCTEEEMFAELDLVDTDRYFSADQIHAFDELNEIIEWNPAKWDDSSAS